MKKGLYAAGPVIMPAMNTGNSTAEVPRRHVPALVVVSSLLLWLSGLARLAELVANALRYDAYEEAYDRLDGPPVGWAAVGLLLAMVIALVIVLSVLALLQTRPTGTASTRWPISLRPHGSRPSSRFPRQWRTRVAGRRRPARPAARRPLLRDASRTAGLGYPGQWSSFNQEDPHPIRNG